jgi:hypothetical protein
MAIAVGATRQVLADAYKGVGTYIGAATGNPGTTATPANEATGGSPSYARKPTTWSSGTGGVVNGTSVTLDVPAATYAWILLASAVSGATMVDASDTTDVVMSGQGTLVVTPTFTQT